MTTFVIDGTVLKTGFMGAEYGIAIADITSAAAEGDYTFTDFDEVTVISAQLNEDPAANCSSVTAVEDETTLNKVTINMWKDDNTSASADWKEVRITVLGKYKTAAEDE